MNLEDKILGEKLQYYCSSSEDEGGDEEESKESGENSKGSSKLSVEPTLPHNTQHWSGNSANTGPKGVIKDWQRFKQLETEKRELQERERLELMKKLSITAKTTAEDQKAKEQEELEAELEDLLNDDFLLEFQKQRMKEMLEMSGLLPKFGSLIHLSSGEEFLKAVDNENKSVSVIIHIYEDKYRACRTMNSCLEKLAPEYPLIKFCKIQSTATQLSKQFKTSALPALLAYKNGQIIGNFVRLHDELGDEFYSSDVENFLIEHALLTDKSLIPIISSSTLSSQQNNDDDDD